jgi:hypothetical protein
MRIIALELTGFHASIWTMRPDQSIPLAIRDAQLRPG